MELVVVSKPDYFEEEGQLFNQFFDIGLQLLHLRKPGNERLRFVKLMEQIDPHYYPRIVIHQHHEMAAKFSLNRLHFPEAKRQKLSIAEIRALKEQGFLLSSSIHQLDLLPELKYLEYVFFGPVFNSISKTGYHTALPVDFVLSPQITKVFAIGGIDAGKLNMVKGMNFDGAAVLGALWHQQETPVQELEKLIKSIKDVH